MRRVGDEKVQVGFIITKLEFWIPHRHIQVREVGYKRNLGVLGGWN